jgi:hypothetical protein
MKTSEIVEKLWSRPFLGIGTDVPALRGRLGVGGGHAVQVGEAGAMGQERAAEPAGSSGPARL